MAAAYAQLVVASLLAICTFQSGVEAIRCAVCESNSAVGLNAVQSTGDGALCFSSGQHPAPIKTCPDTHNYCITLTKYNTDGMMRSLSRSCSPVALPSSCIIGTDKSTKDAVKVCYTTCSEDGCNWKSSLKQLLNLL